MVIRQWSLVLIIAAKVGDKVPELAEGPNYATFLKTNSKTTND